MLLLFALFLCAAFAEFASLCQFGSASENTYPQDGVCNIADQGPFCVGPASHNVAGTYYCGCQVDGDCFNQGNFPTCNPEPGTSDGSGICDSCRIYGPDVPDNVDSTIEADESKESNSFCRLRYPSVDFYLNEFDNTLYQGLNDQGALVDAYPVDDEAVPIYREFCATVGGCKPCNEASPAGASLPAISFPEYQGNELDADGTIIVSSSLDASLKGTFFCHGHSIYRNGPDTVEHLGQTISYSHRPICSSFQNFFAVGLSGNLPFLNEQEWGNSPIVMNSMDALDKTSAATIIDSYQSEDEPQTPRQWNGACIPCRFPALDGTVTKFHGLCYIALENNPICNDEGNCVGCGSNEDCQQMSDVQGCFSDGTGSCTGKGYNCYNDGACRDCRVSGCNNDLNDQEECDQATGICVTPFVWECDGNNGDGGDFACSNANSDVSGFVDEENCQRDGTCLRCSVTRSSSSVSLDDVSSTCDPEDGPPGSTAIQPNCFGSTGICVDRCTNGDPGDQSQCVGTQGANCMTGGICLDCNSDQDCINNDLGDHPICDLTDRICKPAFSCDGNANSGTDSACDESNDIVNEENCQEDGSCLRCNVQRTNSQDTSYSSLSSTCGVLDGPPGNNANQPNCNSATGTCVEACTDAHGDPSSTYCREINPNQPNCMDNGICLRCHSDQDCANNDMGGQTVCDTDGICYPPFDCDGNIDDGTADSCTSANGAGSGRENCQANGQCERCSVSRSSTTCSNNDGPGNGASGQPNCQVSANGGAGRTQHTCINACTNGDPDATFCQGTQGANCMDDGRCFDCESDNDCASNDMGGQDRCDSDGICREKCREDLQGSDCPTGQNCMDDGRCRACSSNDDCIANDGPPGQGSQEECRAGICRDPYCLSNADCAGSVEGPNCGKGGRCYDCRDPDETCGAGASADGPDQIAGSFGSPDQPNCDLDTGICVYYCTDDSDCQMTHKFADSFNHPCEPFCNVDRGCCVECMDDDDCPHAGITDGEKLAWRHDEEDYAYCSINHVCIRYDEVCETDEDCSGSTPACSFAEQKCVECTSDDHCSDPAQPACSTGSQQCVQCVLNAHCGAEEVCVGGICMDEDDLGSDSSDDDDDDDDDDDSALSIGASFLVTLVMTIMYTF